jgi:hypothetical protein
MLIIPIYEQSVIYIVGLISSGKPLLVRQPSPNLALLNLLDRKLHDQLA